MDVSVNWSRRPEMSLTFLITEPQLPCIVHSPAKNSSWQRQGKAVSPSCSHLSQWDPFQRPHPLWAGLRGELLPQAQLPVAVLSPGEKLAIWNKDRITDVRDKMTQAPDTKIS